MRRLTSFAALAMASVGLAQSPLTTLTGTGSGNVGGGIFFDLQIHTTVTITQIDFRCGANTVPGTGTLDLYLGPPTYLGNHANPGLWSFVTSTTCSVAPSTVSNGVLTTPFALAPGNYGVALKSNLCSHGYTNGVTCTSTTIPGSCSNSTFTTAEVTLRAGAAQNSFLTGGVFTPRVFNGAIHYLLGGAPVAFAAWQPQGVGCYSFFRSWYEYQPSGASVDLGGTSVLMTPDTNAPNISYDLTFTNPGTALFPHSSGNTPLPPIATGHHVVTLDAAGPPIVFPGVGGSPVTVPAGTTVEMNADGFVTLLGTNASASPSPGALLSGSPRVGSWQDLDATVAGAELRYEYDAVTNAHYFSWLNCNLVGVAASPCTFQLVFHANLGIELRWGVWSLGSGAHPNVTGFSPGGSSFDPGNRDVSLAAPFRTQKTDNHPLTAAMTARPRLNTTPDIRLGNIPVGASFCAALVSLAGANVPAIALGLQMPDCFVYVDLFHPTTNTLLVAGPGAIADIPFPIPNVASLDGLLVLMQGACLTSGFNPQGVVSSNQIRVTVGSL